MDEQNQGVDPRQVARYILEYQKQMDNLIKYQLDPSAELEQLRRDLLGLEKTRDGLIEIDGATAKISSEGARAIMTFLRLRLTKIISLSNLDDEAIRKRCQAYMDDLTWFLGRHMDEYRIADYQTMNSIIELCDDVFYTTMMKAYDAGERDTLRKQFTHVESSEKITQQKPDAPSLFRNPFSGGTQ